MNTGSVLAGRPCLGSWVSYGLGTENDDLPAFVVLQDNEQAQVAGGPRNWGPGFIPAAHQGTRLRTGREPIPNLFPPEDRLRGPPALASSTSWPTSTTATPPPAQPTPNSTPASRATNSPSACRLKPPRPSTSPCESDRTRTLYGLDQKETEVFGRNCLLARRLVERGVRFVQLYHGAGSKWDAHAGIEKNHTDNCLAMDKPVAGLLKDLKQRGLLDETLVIWGGEFGRTPMSEKGDGRDHNPYGFTMWMAGAGLPGGRTIGTTDELGLHAIEDRLHVHDLHATILALLGADHTRLIYRYKGRPERPTVNEGDISKSILAT